MSYGALGDGWVTLLFDEQAKSGLKSSMSARYNELCQLEQNQPGMEVFRESVIQTYAAKQKALEQKNLSDILKKEFSDIGFYENSVSENLRQRTLYIEASFDGRYYEDRISGLLDILRPFTVEGEFSFRGEDDGLWRLQFTGAEWVGQQGEVAYKDLGDNIAEPCKGPYPHLVEDVGAFEALLTEINSRIKLDDRPTLQRGKQLMTAFQNQDPDGVLLALTGWSLQALGAFAGIWQDSNGTDPS